MIGPPKFGAMKRRPMADRPGVTARPWGQRLAFKIDQAVVSRDPLGRDSTLATVEALLMMADEPLTAKKLAAAAGLADGHAVRRAIEKLQGLYDADESPFTVVELAGGYQLLTRPEYHPWLVRLKRTGHDLKLTAAAMETLAVIAYKQPVMKADVEAIRGVHCGELIHHLMEKGLVRIAGRHDSLGRPQLFGTTKQFLSAFGLKSIEELPSVPSLAKPK